MTWRTPKIGAARVVRRFAFFPMDTDDGVTVCWRRYYSLEVLRVGRRGRRWMASKTSIYPFYWFGAGQ